LKILIVKLSSLGDVVHAMAAVQDIAQALPEAQIDWVVERGFAPLVRRCQGVHRVIPCEMRRWRESLLSAETRRAWQVFKTELQQDTYDAVIDLQGLSKSALVSWLARLGPNGKRYGMANQTDGSSFEAPARWVADVAITQPTRSHAVQRSRQVCASALGYILPFYMTFGLLAHRDQAPVAIKNAAFKAGLNGMVALVHGTSRADKEWPLQHWRDLAKRLLDAGYGVALPHGSAAEEQTCIAIAQDLPHAQVWPLLPLDALTDALASCVGAIGVDSGLSHIAVALDLVHVQIYNFDTAWRTGPLAEPVANKPLVLQGSSLQPSSPPSAHSSHQCSVFAEPTPTVDAVWNAWQGALGAANPPHGPHGPDNG
jgi:heptosyltransferase-1